MCNDTLLCLHFTFSYKEFSQRIIEPLTTERRQVSIYSFLQLIIKFFCYHCNKDFEQHSKDHHIFVTNSALSSSNVHYVLYS